MVIFVIAGVIALAGLGTLALAMRGGPRSTIKTIEPSLDTRRATTIGVTLLVVAGLGLPTWILLHNESSEAAQGPGGKELSADEREGRHLFADKCATCHTLDDVNAVGQVGPDLDVLRPTSELTYDAIVEGRARGRGQMPSLLFNGEEAEHVADYVQRVAGNSG